MEYLIFEDYSNNDYDYEYDNHYYLVTKNNKIVRHFETKSLKYDFLYWLNKNNCSYKSYHISRIIDFINTLSVANEIPIELFEDLTQETTYLNAYFPKYHYHTKIKKVDLEELDEEIKGIYTNVDKIFD